MNNAFTKLSDSILARALAKANMTSPSNRILKKALTKRNITLSALAGGAGYTAANSMLHDVSPLIPLVSTPVFPVAGVAKGIEYLDNLGVISSEAARSANMNIGSGFERYLHAADKVFNLDAPYRGLDKKLWDTAGVTMPSHLSKIRPELAREEFNNMLESIKGSPQYDKVLDIINKRTRYFDSQAMLYDPYKGALGGIGALAASAAAADKLAPRYKFIRNKLY